MRECCLGGKCESEWVGGGGVCIYVCGVCGGGGGVWGVCVGAGGMSVLLSGLNSIQLEILVRR